MNDKSQHCQDALGEDASEEIAQAFFDYKEKLKEILSKFSNTELHQYCGVVTREEISEAFQARHLVPRMVAQSEIYYRGISAKASKVLDAGAKSYCVVHDQDGALCAKEHDDY